MLAQGFPEYLKEALDQRTPEGVKVHAPYARLLGNFVLLDERTTAHTLYTGLVPRYYGEVTGALKDGQEQQGFRGDMNASEMAALALDTLAMACAVHLDDSATRTRLLPPVVLDGLVVG